MTGSSHNAGLTDRHVVVDGLSMHIVQGGSLDKPTVFFLHGWPQSAIAFNRVMQKLSPTAQVVAIDLPGIGGSSQSLPSNDARSLAKCMHAVIESLSLRDVTLIGHDVGGQIVYAYLKDFPGELDRAVMMNIVIPGIDPWGEVIRNPHIWHFGFHAVPELPELLVMGHQEAYFDFFYNVLAAQPGSISATSRRAYAEAYSRPTALRTGFDWYRAFPKDAEDNKASRGTEVTIPVLYVRGDTEAAGISIDRYLRGFNDAGLRQVTGREIENCGHFTPDEQPAALASVLREFMELGR